MKSPDKEFISESEEILEDAVDLLLDVQESPEKEINPDSVNALFRCMHTIKGMAGLYGYQGLSDLSHSLESLLDDVRLGKAAMSEDVVGFLFKAVDILKSLLDDLRSGRADKHMDVSEHLSWVESFMDSLKKAEETGSLEGVIDSRLLRVLSEYEEHRLRANLKDGKMIYTVRQVFSLDDFDVKLKELSGGLKTMGELISTMPVSEDIPQGSIGFKLIVGSHASADEFREKLNIEVEELAPRKTETKGPHEVAPSKASTNKASTTVRVDIQKLDRVLNTIGELSVMRNTIQGIWADMSETYGHTHPVLELYRVSQTIGRRISRLQQQVLEIRMVPVGQIFGKLAQVVRRFSMSLGKKIDLSVFGEDTEIDKYIAEEVQDPLVHLVRNAIDHGIEPADDRRAAGKDENGRMRLRALQKGNNVIIEVSDDGSGIDRDAVMRKAMEKGIIKDGEGMQEKEIFGLLFAPGFSTKDNVSEVSGRGVGLDIVREKLSALGGGIEIESRVGEGTTFVLSLPITLAVVKALTVRVGEQKYAVPLSSMSETVTVEHRDIRKVENRSVFTLRGEVLPVESLRSIFMLPDSPSDRFFAVVVGQGDRRMGLLVDELLGQNEVVIKSIGGYFEGLRGIGGAAEVGKNEVVLVLDVESVIDMSLSERGGAPHV